MSVEVEIDMSVTVSDDEKTLGVFLYTKDEGHRARLRAVLHREGGEYTTYPSGSFPAEATGSVILTNGSVAVFVGSVYTVGIMDLAAHNLSAIRRATVFLVDEPFDITDKGEKVFMAVTLPLEILEGDGHERA